MDKQLEQTPNGIYFFNSNVDPQQLFNAVNACLCKTEALALTAATTDFESYDSDTINNYMWALSDIIRETKCLYEKATRSRNRDSDNVNTSYSR